jgi:quercetin dioxygenase-like cupin family protein
MGMELDVTHAVVLEPGAGRKLERPELMVIESHRGADDPGVAPHVHREHADAIYVLEGEIDFFLAGETVHASAGWFVLSPPGVVHGFGPGPARRLNFHAPGAPYAAPGRDSYDPPEDGGEGQAVVVAPGEGERLTATERVVLVKASLPELTLSEFELGPRFEGPDPHRHDDHVDSFYVLDGEVEFLLGGETVRGGPGTFVAAPPGILHTFTNPGPAGARLLNMHSPDGGFLDFLRRPDRQN